MKSREWRTQKMSYKFVLLCKGSRCFVIKVSNIVYGVHCTGNNGKKIVVKTCMIHVPHPSDDDSLSTPPIFIGVDFNNRYGGAGAK